MTPKASWSRAGLMVRLQPPADPKVFWWHHSMTIDDARALVRELTIAIGTGQAHLDELKAAKPVEEPLINPRTGEGHP